MLDNNARFIVRQMIADSYAVGFHDGRMDEADSQAINRELTPKGDSNV